MPIRTTPLITLAVASTLLSGCTSLCLKDTNSALPQIEEGIWVSHSIKFPGRPMEYLVSPKTEMQLGAPLPQPSNQRLYRNRAPRLGLVTTEFSIKANEGRSTVYDATYRLEDDTYIRLPKKKKDHYAGLTLRYDQGKIIVTKSEERMLKAYAGNTFTPLTESTFFQAIRNGDEQSVQRIIRKDPELVSTVNTLGRTPLYQATLKGHPSIVSRLLEAGAPVDIRNQDEKQHTALNAAIQKSELKILKALLHAGADSNQQDTLGDTPLHIATQGCGEFRKVVRILLKAGADPHIENKRGESVIEALERKSKNFLSIFKEEHAQFLGQ